VVLRILQVTGLLLLLLLQIGAKTGRGVGLVSMYRAAVLVMAASLGSAVALACISI